VLACVAESAGGSQQEVSDSIEVDRSEMVRIVDRLEQGGMVIRERDQNDRRRYSLKLTPSGRRALQRSERVTEAVTQDALSRLSDSERGALHDLTLRALGESRARRS
jgi:DNA-binding MarR family transcriptional regulator